MKQGFLAHRRTTLCYMMLRSGTPIKTDQLHVEIQAVKQPVSFYDQKINHDIYIKKIYPGVVEDVYGIYSHIINLSIHPSIHPSKKVKKVMYTHIFL